MPRIDKNPTIPATPLVWAAAPGGAGLAVTSSGVVRAVIQRARRSAECPLLAQSGHAGRGNECLLLGVKRISLGHSEMSAFAPKRTFGPDDCCDAQCGSQTGVFRPCRPE